MLAAAAAATAATAAQVLLLPLASDSSQTEKRLRGVTGGGGDRNRGAGDEEEPPVLLLLLLLLAALAFEEADPDAFFCWWPSELRREWNECQRRIGSGMEMKDGEAGATAVPTTLGDDSEDVAENVVAWDADDADDAALVVADGVSVDGITSDDEEALVRDRVYFCIVAHTCTPHTQTNRHYRLSNFSSLLSLFTPSRFPFAASCKDWETRPRHSLIQRKPTSTSNANGKTRTITKNSKVKTSQAVCFASRLGLCTTITDDSTVQLIRIGQRSNSDWVLYSFSVCWSCVRLWTTTAAEVVAGARRWRRRRRRRRHWLCHNHRLFLFFFGFSTSSSSSTSFSLLSLLSRTPLCALSIPPPSLLFHFLLLLSIGKQTYPTHRCSGRRFPSCCCCW